jgi:hypothetical protein
LELRAANWHLSREDVWAFNFSALKTPGMYRARVAGIGSSPPFPIADSALDFGAYTAARALYYQRCGYPGGLQPPFADPRFARPACHLHSIPGEGNATVDATGKSHATDVAFHESLVRTPLYAGALVAAFSALRTRFRSVFIAETDLSQWSKDARSCVQIAVFQFKNASTLSAIGCVRRWLSLTLPHRRCTTGEPVGAVAGLAMDGHGGHHDAGDFNRCAAWQRIIQFKIESTLDWVTTGYLESDPEQSCRGYVLILRLKISFSVSRSQRGAHCMSLLNRRGTQETGHEQMKIVNKWCGNVAVCRYVPSLADMMWYLQVGFDIDPDRFPDDIWDIPERWAFPNLRYILLDCHVLSAHMAC